MQIVPMRLFFQKMGRLKYISHLDVVNVFSRALSRSGLPIWFTQGFNPRTYISFPFPLSLGYEGKREVVEIRLTEEVSPETIKEALNKVLPTELAIQLVGTIGQDPSMVSWADYHLELYLPAHGKKLEGTFEVFCRQEEIMVDKKSKKKKTKQMNIAPWVEFGEISSTTDEILLSACIATGITLNINPRLIAEAFEAYAAIKIESLSVVRGNIYTTNKELFL